MKKVSPTVAEIEALRKAAPDGAVVMINLLKFAPDGGREAYRRYVEVGTRACEQAGVTARPIFTGTAGADVGNGEDWDFVAIVEYSSINEIADVLTHPTYQNEAIPLRNQALSKAVFMASFPAGLITVWESTT